MKTKTYKTYREFLEREDKDENGVSETFAELHPNYIEENESNRACWDCSGCSRCSRCSGCSDCSDCFGCSDCSRCFGCSRCSGCSDCSDCFDCFDKKGDLRFPVIRNIHQSVLYAVTNTPDALNMKDWHTCNTTHCRAGWVVTLAGEEGADLEKKTSTAFAAFQIYKASSPIKVTFPRFFDSDEEAMADIKRCADEEIKLK